MPDRQRILVVSTTANDADLLRIGKGLGRDPVVLTAPTTEAERVVRALGVEPYAEVLLAPVRFPQVDRGHRLDELVRRHAVRDRLRDVVVVTDPATSTLLLRVIAPGQLPTQGPVTVVGLPRANRSIAVRRAVISGLALGVVASMLMSLVPLLAMPVAVALAGLALLLVVPWRHLGRELLLSAAIAVGVIFVVVAGSARFPGGW